MSIRHDVKDLNLADAGREAIESADQQMRFCASSASASWEEGT